ncbi:hypothetical protein BGW80DRAFT_1263785 [Lactifluus volemus]|nr:hypothetical protein BGW80DRAFT_1263785 [Lactifluus volemus]
MRTHLCLYLVLLDAFISVQAFTFSNNVPTECGNFEVSWTGGQQPFVLEMAPVDGSQRVFNIPASAFSNGAGKFNIPQLTLSRETQFLVTMSDATGFATGGISPLLTVEAPTGAATCNSTDPGPSFFFSLDDALQQCKPYTFSAFPGAIQPVTIFGLVPGGTAVVLNVPNPSTKFVWSAASVSAGTGIIFVMSDSQNRTGGASPIKVSSATSDSSCLNSNSPSVTLQGTSSTLLASPTSSSGRASNSTKRSGATLAAAIASVLVGLVALVALSLFLFRRNQSRRPRDHVDLGDGYRDEPSSPFPYTVDPFPPPDPTNNTHYEMPHIESSTANLGPPTEAEVAAAVLPSVSSSTSSSVPSSRTRKTDVTASTTRFQPARFIVHTDVEEVEVEPDDNGVIELPPQYNEHRQPLSFRTSSHAPSSTLSSDQP